MKNVLLAILSFVYLAATTGVGIEQHFCCGRLSNVELTFKDHPVLASEHGVINVPAGSNGCCKDLVKVVRISQNQTAATAFTWTPPPSFSIVLPILPKAFRACFYPISGNCFLFHSPPVPGVIHPYLKNCTFLI